MLVASFRYRQRGKNYRDRNPHRLVRHKPPGAYAATEAKG